jgi:catechol 2,3-dioxygenase-like lactoylglutathione lyase family enzyme
MTTMQQCRVRGVRSVEIAATNLEEAGRFYESVWGLRRVEARDGVQLYRGTAAYHHIVGLHRGPRPGLMRIVFDVADREGVDALHRAIVAAGGPATAPATLAADGGGYGFGCTDPDGRNLAFVCACADHADAQDIIDRPRQIAHVNLNALNFDASYRFFTQTLGFRQIDENAPLWFLHCDSSEHSSIVLAKIGLATLNHIAFEMPDFDSVMRGMGRMKDNGYPIEWGPGRHGPGNNVFAYFCGPDEVPIEYTAEVLQVDDSYVFRGPDQWVWPPGRTDQWGIAPPKAEHVKAAQLAVGYAAA